MPEPNQLSEREKTLLSRILASSPAREKRLAYAMWGVALAMFAAMHVAVFARPDAVVPLAAGSAAAFLIGLARFGYYRLYRLLHYQAESGRDENSPGPEEASQER